jgi:hypothetical protein
MDHLLPNERPHPYRPDGSPFIGDQSFDCFREETTALYAPNHDAKSQFLASRNFTSMGEMRLFSAMCTFSVNLRYSVRDDERKTPWL